MGLLGLFSSNISNPALVAAIEKYCGDGNDENLVELWDKFLKSKVLLATTADGAKAFGKVKQMREAVGLSFHCTTNERGDNLLIVYSDSETYKARVPETTPHVTVTGEQAFQLASAKGLLGLVLNPKGDCTCELKVWQHQVFIEKIADPIKLHALASKLVRSGNQLDAEGVLKAAIFASQREHGAQHAFTAELQIELARVLRSQNKIEQAEWTYRRALQIYEAAGSMDLELATTCEALGMMLMDAGRAPQAVPMLERALQIYERIPGGRPDSIARILCLLGDLRCEQGKPDEGEHLYKRASVTLEERKHPDVFGVLLKMGALCEKTGRHKEALAHYNRVISAFDSWKRGREIELAKAAHRAGLLHLEDNKPFEAQPLLERALQSYRREQAASQIEEVEALLQKVKEQADLKAKEEAQSTTDPNKAAFGRATGKRPADLPLLDMQAVKSNPRATFVGAKAPAEPKEEKPLDAEEAALAQMRAFLDSVNKEGPMSTSGTGPAAPADPVAAPPPLPSAPAEDEAAVTKLLQETIHGHDAAPVVQPAARALDADRFDKPIGERAKDADRFDKPISERTADVARFDKPIGERAKDADRFDKPISERTADVDRFDKPISERTADVAKEPEAAAPAEENGGLFSNLDGSLDSAFKGVMAEPAKEADRFDKPIGERAKDADRFDKPISERMAEAAKEPEAAAPAEENGGLFSDLDGSLDSAFKGVMADPVKDADRFDKPIGERAKDADRFDKPISERAKDADRFDKPISERAAETPTPVAEAAAAVEEIKLDADWSQALKSESKPAPEASADEDEHVEMNDLFSGVATSSSAPAPKIKSPAASFVRPGSAIPPRQGPPPLPPVPKPVAESSSAPPVVSSSKADEERKSFEQQQPAHSISGAELGKNIAADISGIFSKSALGDLGKDDRFDKPISERNAEQDMSMMLNKSMIEQATKDLSRFDKPISERSAVPAADQPASEAAAAKLDPSRFDQPIQSRAGGSSESEDSGGLFSDLDDSLDSAFKGIMSDGAKNADCFDKPIQERAEKPAGQDTTIQIKPAPRESLAVTAEIEKKPAAADEVKAEPKAEPKPEPAPETNPASEKPKVDLATAKTPEELLELLDQRLQDEPNNGELWLRKGTTLAQLQRLDEAIKVFDKVTTLFPDDLKGWYCKGSSLHLKGRFEDAAYCFNHVLKLEPDNVKALMRKAECLGKLGRSDQSMALYDRITVLQPKFVAGWLSKARALVQERKLEEAQKVYEHVLAIEPGNEEATRAKHLITSKLGAAAST